MMVSDGPDAVARGRWMDGHDGWQIDAMYATTAVRYGVRHLIDV